MPTISPRRRLVFVAMLACLAAGLPVASAELLMRWRGYQPWSPMPVLHANEQQVSEPDPDLTWHNKPGRHVFPGYSPQAAEVRITIDEDGTRFSGPRPARPRARVALVGDSITMGWAISDHETFAWKLQQRFPDVAFENYGVSGFGTYQSLLVMRRFLADDPPDLVLYGFYNDHLQRNVQSYQWVNLHDRNRRELTAPYCTIDAAGRLVEHRAEVLPQWPLRQHLASVFFLEQQWVRRRAARRAADAWPVGRQLALTMHEEARRHGSRFVFVFLMSRPAVTKPYQKFLAESGISSLDCQRSMRPEWAVVGEGHPNDAMNSEWADCLAGALPGLLAQRRAP